MNLYREIPKIDTLLKEFGKKYDKKIITNLSQTATKKLRAQIKRGEVNQVEKHKLIEEIKKEYKLILNKSLKPLINATGVVLHTNLGRSLIDEDSFNNIKELVCGYTNLEYDVKNGTRGERYSHISRLFCYFFGCEDVLIVNNNASAVFLILNTFAKQSEVIVSRGELVEIGGSFRVPDVMKESGAQLVEVGTTNKTKLSDYKNAITCNSALLMKVHKSNFSMEGFCEDVEFLELIKLAKEKNIIDYYDLGGGYSGSLPYGLDKNEPSLQELMKHNPSLVSFSGDKLFGSVQAGVIMGKKSLIDKLKKNQLLRMLRVDKITLALLEETMLAHTQNQLTKIPTLHMLNLTCEELKQRAAKIISSIKNPSTCRVIEVQTVVGGGTMPNRKYPSIALHVEGEPKKIEKYFREKSIIGRIQNNKFLLDLRTVKERDTKYILQILNNM